MCRGCLTPLRLLAPAPSGAAAPEAGPGPDARPRPAPVTVRDPVRPGLRLEFSTGAIVVRAGESVTLGRGWQECPDADVLASFDNLSRRHATVSVDEDGNGWIQDERSTNGTFVGGRRLRTGQRVPLRPGVPLRLAADVPVTVRRSGRR